MPYDFDTSVDPETQDNEPQIPQPIFDAAINPARPEPAETELGELMDEAEKRFAKAQYYRALLTESIFEGDESPTAGQVVEEIRGFIKERLAVLLGVKPEPTHQVQRGSDFSEDETKILKQVAARLLKKPELAQPPPEPTLKKVGTPSKPSVKAAKTAKTQARTQPVPTPKPIGNGPSPMTPAQKTAPVSKGDLHFTGEYIDIDNKRYHKAVDPRGEHYVGPDNQKYLIGTNGEGQYFLKNVTPVARPVGVTPVPSLTSDMMAMVSARHVNQAIRQDPVASGNIFTHTASPTIK